MPTSSKKEKISVGEIIQKALTRGENWNKTTFEKFPQVLFWLRIVIAFILGLSWAFVKLEGQLGLISYAAASSLIVFLYYEWHGDIEFPFFFLPLFFLLVVVFFFAFVVVFIFHLGG